jgi:hypothetical protein
VRIDLKVLGEELATVVKGHVSPILKRLEAVEKRQPEKGARGEKGIDGKDADEAKIVAEVLAKMPVPLPGRDGVDGKDAPAVDVEKLAADVLARVRVPVDGKDADQEAITKAVLSEVTKALDAIPIPKDGRDGVDGIDGKDAPPIDYAHVIAEVAKQIPAPKDGKDGADADPVDVEKVIDGVLARVPKPKDGEKGIDGTSVTVDQVMPLLEATLTKNLLEWERRANDMMTKAIERIPAPKDGIDGRDGFGFDDMSVEYDGERGLKFVLERAGVRKTFDLHLPIPIYREVLKSNTKALRGDNFTYGGNIWIAKRDTETRPPGDDWVLAVRKGRDGKDSEE